MGYSEKNNAIGAAIRVCYGCNRKLFDIMEFVIKNGRVTKQADGWKPVSNTFALKLGDKTLELTQDFVLKGHLLFSVFDREGAMLFGLKATDACVEEPYKYLKSIAINFGKEGYELIEEGYGRTLYNTYEGFEPNLPRNSEDKGCVAARLSNLLEFSETQEKLDGVTKSVSQQIENQYPSMQR